MSHEKRDENKKIYADRIEIHCWTPKNVSI